MFRPALVSVSESGLLLKTGEVWSGGFPGKFSFQVGSHCRALDVLPTVSFRASVRLHLHLYRMDVIQLAMFLWMFSDWLCFPRMEKASPPYGGVAFYMCDNNVSSSSIVALSLSTSSAKNDFIASICGGSSLFRYFVIILFLSIRFMISQALNSLSQ